MRPFALVDPEHECIPVIVWDDNSYEIDTMYVPVEAFTGDAAEIERELSIRDGVLEESESESATDPEYAPLWEVVSDQSGEYVRAIIIKSTDATKYSHYIATAVLILINAPIILSPVAFEELSG